MRARVIRADQVRGSFHSVIMCHLCARDASICAIIHRTRSLKTIWLPHLRGTERVTLCQGFRSCLPRTEIDAVSFPQEDTACDLQGVVKNNTKKTESLAKPDIPHSTSHLFRKPGRQGT